MGGGAGGGGEPAHVAVAVAHALGVSYDEESALNALREYVRNKHMLIVLDNCEHLIAACAEVAVSLLQVAQMLAYWRPAVSR